jgi:integrase
MQVYKPTYHSPVYEPARYFTKKGVKYVRFRKPRSGEFVTGELLPNGKAKVEQDYYAARINGKRVCLKLKDKFAAEQKAAKMALMEEHQQAGCVDKYAEHRAIPLLDHLKQYETALESDGCCAEHIGETIRLIERTLLACSFKYIEEFNAHSMNSHLVGLIRKGKSFRTRNKTLQHMRAFIHWLQNNDRMGDADPFRKLKMLNQEADPNKRLRRALSAEELTLLTAAAEAGPVVQGITGPERALIYATAVTTGLRAKELASLKVRDLHLDEELPYIVLPPSVAKARREDVLPIHPTVATKLEEWVQGRTGLVFNLMTEHQTGGTGGKMRLTGRMIRSDLKRAKVPYKTEDGFADLHALRTTFITNVCRLTDQFTAMKLARHTKATVTARHYDKVQLSHRGKVTAMLAAPVLEVTI